LFLQEKFAKLPRLGRQEIARRSALPALQEAFCATVSGAWQEEQFFECRGFRETTFKSVSLLCDRISHAPKSLECALRGDDIPVADQQRHALESPAVAHRQQLTFHWSQVESRRERSVNSVVQARLFVWALCCWRGDMLPSNTLALGKN
jgi:hypothetical protein